jgi:glycosyltransferase involved in cell wall biosynthesis
LRRGRAKRPRLIYIAHGWAGDQYSGAKARLVRAVEGTLCGFADLVINVSHNDLETARRHGYRGRHTVIENAVPDAVAGARDDCFAAEPEALHLLFVGRFDRQKGLDILLEALASAQKLRPELKLHLIGGAVRSGNTPAFPPGVDHVGWVPSDEVDQWYRSADALVVPSRWEGFGLVVAEAFRNGTPALVSDRGALPDLVEEGVTGHVFTLEGGDLRNRLLKLDKSSLRAMRPACRAIYERRYSMPRLYAEILRAYRGETGAAAE